MAYFILLFTIFLLGSVAADDVCGPNASLKTGINCKSDCCPEPKGQNSCPDPCANACQCNLMYRRASNGTCILARECPPIPCPANEVFESCPVCSESCQNANAEGRRCPKIGRILMTVICNPKCRCIDNYWRNSHGECVPYDQCSQNNCNCLD